MRSHAAAGMTGPPTATGAQSLSISGLIACAPDRTAQLNPCPLLPSLTSIAAVIRYWLVAPGPHGTGIGSS